MSPQKWDRTHVCAFLLAGLMRTNFLITQSVCLPHQADPQQVLRAQHAGTRWDRKIRRKVFYWSWNIAISKKKNESSCMLNENGGIRRTHVRVQQKKTTTCRSTTNHQFSILDPKFRMVRSRLYRSRYLQTNISTTSHLFCLYYNYVFSVSSNTREKNKRAKFSCVRLFQIVLEPCTQKKRKNKKQLK